MFKHCIGIDYAPIIKTRKNKRNLPLIGKLNFTIDVQKAVSQLESIVEIGKQVDFLKSGKDKASNEHNYNLPKKDGSNFVNNYNEVYKIYAAVGLQSLSDEAIAHAKLNPKKVDDFSPFERSRGMRDTGSKYYHSHYDERNYTKPTNYCNNYFEQILNMFNDETCRSGVVCLHPGKFLAPHFDIGPEFVARIQIPLITNRYAVIGVRNPNDKNEWYEYHLPADGSVYFINSGWEHYAVNNGSESRYQIRICLNGQASLANMTTVDPDSIFSNEEFSTRVESGQYYGDNSDNVGGSALTELNLNPEQYTKKAKIF